MATTRRTGAANLKRSKQVRPITGQKPPRHSTQTVALLSSILQGKGFSEHEALMTGVILIHTSMMENPAIDGWQLAIRSTQRTLLEMGWAPETVTALLDSFIEILNHGKENSRWPADFI